MKRAEIYLKNGNVITITVERIRARVSPIKGGLAEVEVQHAQGQTGLLWVDPDSVAAITVTDLESIPDSNQGAPETGG